MGNDAVRVQEGLLGNPEIHAVLDDVAGFLLQIPLEIAIGRFHQSTFNPNPAFRGFSCGQGGNGEEPRKGGGHFGPSG
jgi:hypothetical protein